MAAENVFFNSHGFGTRLAVVEILKRGVIGSMLQSHSHVPVWHTRSNRNGVTITCNSTTNKKLWASFQLYRPISRADWSDLLGLRLITVRNCIGLHSCSSIWVLPFPLISFFYCCHSVTTFPTLYIYSEWRSSYTNDNIFMYTHKDRYVRNSEYFPSSFHDGWTTSCHIIIIITSFQSPVSHHPHDTNTLRIRAHPSYKHIHFPMSILFPKNTFDFLPSPPVSSAPPKDDPMQKVPGKFLEAHLLFR